MSRHASPPLLFRADRPPSIAAERRKAAETRRQNHERVVALLTRHGLPVRMPCPPSRMFHTDAQIQARHNTRDATKVLVSQAVLDLMRADRRDEARRVLHAWNSQNPGTGRVAEPVEQEDGIIDDNVENVAGEGRRV